MVLNEGISDPKPRVTNMNGTNFQSLILRPESDSPMCPASNAFSVEPSRSPQKSMQPRLGAHPRTQRNKQRRVFMDLCHSLMDAAPHHPKTTAPYPEFWCFAIFRVIRVIQQFVSSAVYWRSAKYLQGD